MEHLERFGVPGKTLIGSDSHTPTGGGIGMIAMGAGGLDVAVAMGGGTYYITCPKIVKVELTGKLSPWVAAKDVILEVLKRLSVKGGVGKVIEYCGEGVKTLSVPERATITNMGAELGATTSIFPSDEVTKQFLEAQGRGEVWTEQKADPDAVYDEVVTINLSELVPLAACPHSPDNVKSVVEIGKLKIDQVCIGSCTNSSLLDMMKVAYILKGKTVNPDVSLSIAPGSKQVLTMMAELGLLEIMIDAGARILESACGPCIGMGQSPNSGGISLRTFNRNFLGRSGTKDGQIYLVSPELAAYSALTGYLSDPRELGEMPTFTLPEKFKVHDNMIVKPVPAEEMDSVLGKRGKSKNTLLVLTERKTRNEIIFKLPDHTDEAVVAALDRLERKWGADMFKRVFKTITVDNGSEFADAEGLQRSIINEGEKRTKVYYCHPYSSWERGTNEVTNKMIRRKIPKGTNFDDRTEEEVESIENWINGYPRKIHGYHSAGELFEEEVKQLA